MSQSLALDVKDLNAFYGKSQVTFDLSLEVGRGEVVAVLGRNGAGKTSSVSAIAGVVSAEFGTLRLAGEEISHLPAHRRVSSGLMLVPSGSRAFPDLTVEENLEITSGRSAGGRRWSIEDVFDVFPKLKELRRSKGSQLSGGERQMLAVGRGMVAGPSVLMLDEPSEGLAPLMLRDIGTMLKQLTREGLSVLLTEQNHRFALRLAERAYFIEKGQVVWTGPAVAASEAEVVGQYLGV